MAGYGLCGKIVATAGNGDALASYLLDAALALEDINGCHLYIVSRDPVEPEAVWVVEFWENAEAHQASLELSAVQQLIARARPIIATMGERFEFQPVGVRASIHVLPDRGSGPAGPGRSGRESLRLCRSVVSSPCAATRRFGAYSAAAFGWPAPVMQRAFLPGPSPCPGATSMAVLRRKDRGL